MTRDALVLRAALSGVIAVLLAGGCGQPGLPTSAAKAGPTAVQTSPEGAATATPDTSGGAGGGHTPAGTPVTRTPTPTPRSSPTATAITGLPEILSFTGVASRCPTASGTVSVKLTWTSKNATAAWMTNPPVAVAASDPKTTQGATGPLPPNGSITMTFDCRSEYGYYDLGVYGGGHSGGEVLQVPRVM
ncbi:MAG: hypothetical protein E6J41_19040 [Chloroflexi bacterium]|nr:MAG: hypothetical protein E6J41_19040 [Chloroflexota bacterium]